MKNSKSVVEKKTKTDPKSVSASKKDTTHVTSIEEVEKVRDEIMGSSKNYNKIIKLLNSLQQLVLATEKDIKNDDLRLSRALIFNLSRIFSFFISKRILKLRKTHTEQEQIVCKWLIGKYEAYQKIIFDLWKVNRFSEGIATLKLDSLEEMMKLLKEEGSHLGPNIGEQYFPNSTYKKIVRNLLVCGDINQIEAADGTIDDYLILEFQDSYFNKYWDLKFYFFNELPSVLANVEGADASKLIFSKLVTLTKSAPMYDVADKQSITELPLWVKNAPENTVYSVNTFKINFEKSWISALNFQSLAKYEYLSTLAILHKRMIPFFSDAPKLMDFLTASYTLGIKSRDIIMAILSLNGLWELMKSHNLDYPDFYKNLYAILTPDLLHLKEKFRFFRLLDIFMSSTHLSAAIVASFIKRLARLCLTAPPSGIILVVPFIYNLIRKHGHSTCVLLIHSTTTKEQDLEYVDPFDENETDPALTEAIGSSIWELETMHNHYHPNVSALIKIFSQHFTKYSYNMEDFLDWSYSKLIETEMKKNLKGELGIEFEKWKTMFDDDGYFEDYLY